MNKPQTRSGKNNPCQGAGVLMRKEWRTLPVPERKAFIAAVQCIMKQPVLSDSKRVPMAKSLYDDFVAVHYTSFRNTHLTASFFAWHRYYLATFEQRLRTQCGYNGKHISRPAGEWVLTNDSIGALPYWEWGLDVKNPAASPVFDGSETSLGSDGEFVPHDGFQLRQPFSNNLITLKPGTGGGCIKSGPFKDMRIHIGPAALAQYGSEKPFNVSNPLQDLPRCLKRDLNKDVATRFNSFRNTTMLVLEQTTIEKFSSLLQGDDRFFPNTLGIHGGGHFIIGGDPGADATIAPGDPAFWLNQAQVDRVYWIWQNLDFKNRQGVFGTMTLQDNPKSPNGSVEDTVDLTPINSPVKIKNLMNTASGAPLCYMYQ
ncbi:tyrosinase-like protein orsC [Colletotrichum spaethianum]|uniref:Tyrosinase-like protein orsC n=1 Tax=Colletotrichum spaethianum TaxID=700344 RepID=A0AA37P8W3_9PEZI|nr:tyrosinase-like protein orsC [Colletotrichum spaethianum]GKT47800.1 tyrosinase-like protein orsC [Colletotrichum spaethianum]